MAPNENELEQLLEQAKEDLEHVVIAMTKKEAVDGARAARLRDHITRIERALADLRLERKLTRDQTQILEVIAKRDKQLAELIEALASHNGEASPAVEEEQERALAEYARTKKVLADFPDEHTRVTNLKRASEKARRAQKKAISDRDETERARLEALLTSTKTGGSAPPATAP